MSVLGPAQSYQALGPFPLGTRELPFLSSPLHAFYGSSASSSSHPTTNASAASADPFLAAPYGQDFPSAYGINGSASWLTLQPDDQGWIDVQWDESAANWDSLRRTEGWAGLQHLALLRSELEVPHDGDYTGLLVQGHAWAVVSQVGGEDEPLEWFTGDIYAFSDGAGDGDRRREDVYGQVVTLNQGKHWVYLKALYEIRMFGDPEAAPPNIHLKFTLSPVAPFPIEPPSAAPDRQLYRQQAPRSPAGRPAARAFGPDAGMVGLGDVVDGWIWGDVAGIAVRAGAQGALVESVTLSSDVEGLAVSLRSPARLAPHQLRPLTLNVTQTRWLSPDVTSLSLSIATSDGDLALVVPLAHLAADRSHTVRYVFLDSDGTASYATTHPPTDSKGEQHAVVLALHGAGVEASWAFWTDAVKPRARSWVIFPTGRTAWGYDWHALSVENLWLARRGLASLAARLGKEPLVDASVVVGHSNGGQGSTHLFLHHPDALQASLSAAAYLKIQSYVAYSQWVSSHHADPALWGLLLSSLAASDEDVLAANGVGLGRALVHGREDDNVPVWHGREMSGLHAQHSSNSSLAIASYQEVPGESHWFDSILSTPFVESFLAAHTPVRPDRYPAVYREQGFELVVANPDEQGSKGGFRITQIDRVGRLARLSVGPLHDDDTFTVQTSNTRSFTLDLGDTLAASLQARSALVDGTRLLLPACIVADRSFSTPSTLAFHRPSRSAPWEVDYERYVARAPVRRYGPLISILSTSGPLVVVVPAQAKRHARLARRIAHDAWVYGRIDARIVSDEEVKEEMQSGEWEAGLGGSWVVVGGHENALSSLLQSTPLRFPAAGLITVTNDDGPTTFDPTSHPSTGVLALHPHPLNPDGLALVLAGTDAAGLERAFRLFPVRTGTPSLDWMVVGRDADWKGAGGVLGAGWWSSEWSWEESGSWLA